MFDRSLALDAARQLEAAARRLRQLYPDTNPRAARTLLGEARALVAASLARFEHATTIDKEDTPS